MFSNSVRRHLIFKYSDKPLELVESFRAGDLSKWITYKSGGQLEGQCTKSPPLTEGKD